MNNSKADPYAVRPFYGALGELLFTTTVKKMMLFRRIRELQVDAEIAMLASSPSPAIAWCCAEFWNETAFHDTFVGPCPRWPYEVYLARRRDPNFPSIRDFNPRRVRLA